ncbi:MAG: ABC transporter permease [Nitrospirota bacterium]
MVRLLAVIERDLRKFMRNPVVIAMSVIMPLIYLVILGNSFQGEVKNLPVAVVNHDTGHYSKRLMENMRTVEAGIKTFKLFKLSNQQEAVEGVKGGHYKAAVTIPSDLSRRVAINDLPEIGLFLDNSDSISADAINRAMAGIVQGIKIEYIPVREPRTEIYLRNQNLYPKVDYDQSLIPGVVVMAIFLGTMTTGVFNLVMDRFLGMDESYFLTPITKGEIVAGLIVSGLIITTILATLVFAVSMLITGISLTGGIKQCGSILIVIILTTLGLLSMMFLFLGRVRHPRIVGIFGGFLNVIFFFPSGAVYPVESFPAWLKAFATVNPEAYAIDALKAIIFKGASLQSITGDIIFLSIFTLLMMIAAIVTFKRTL